MALYSVYLRPGSSGARPAFHDDTRLIRSGPSWLAFLFPVVWLLVNRVWRWFLVILALDISLAVFVGYYGLPDWSLFLAGLAVMLYVGISGRDWLGAALEQRGYVLMATNIAGENEDEAYAAFVRRPKQDSKAIAETRTGKSAESGPVLGLFPEPEARL